MTAFYLCRICLTEDTNPKDMLPLFDKTSYSSKILQRIEECGGVALKEKDGFPTMICEECILSLDISHKFRSMCQFSEISLQEALVTKLDIKEEMEDLRVTDSDDDADFLFNEIEAEEIEILTEKNEIDSCSNHAEVIISDFSVSGSQLVYKEHRKKKSPPKRSTQSKTIKKRRLAVALDNAGDQQNPSKGRKKQLPNVKQIMCEICGNIYAKHYLLKSHMRIHMDEKPYECEICKKSFARTSQIRRHLRVHTGKKPYVCKFCGRAFGDHSTHVKHVRIHTQERPYSCNTCGKSFTRSNILNNHMLTHTGEKSFSCYPCNKHFTLKHQLEQHTATLTHKQTIG